MPAHRQSFAGLPRNHLVLCPAHRHGRRPPLHRRPLSSRCAQLCGRHAPRRRTGPLSCGQFSLGGFAAASPPIPHGAAPSALRHPRGGHHRLERKNDSQGVDLPVALPFRDGDAQSALLQLANRRAALGLVAQRAQPCGPIRSRHQSSGRNERTAPHHSSHPRCTHQHRCGT